MNGKCTVHRTLLGTNSKTSIRSVKLHEDSNNNNAIATQTNTKKSVAFLHLVYFLYFIVVVALASIAVSRYAGAKLFNLYLYSPETSNSTAKH